LGLSIRLQQIIHEKVRLNRERIYGLAGRIDSALSAGQCVDCKENDPAKLEFDHVRGKKAFAISHALTKMVTLDELELELAKCDIRCRNCHLKRHHPDGHRYLDPKYLDYMVDRATRVLMKHYGFRV
jgi:hypothetical protein